MTRGCRMPEARREARMAEQRRLRRQLLRQIAMLRRRTTAVLELIAAVESRPGEGGLPTKILGDWLTHACSRRTPQSHRHDSRRIHVSVLDEARSRAALAWFCELPGGEE